MQNQVTMNAVAQPAKSRILVVDDTDDIRMLMTLILENAGYEVMTAADGAEALAVVRRDPPDLVLLDVMMPGMDGYAVCEQLKADEATQAIPVLFLTALSEIEAETRGLELGAADFITKPISMGVLLARVKTHLALYAQRRSLEGMFRDVIEFAPDAFILTDPQGRIVQINARAEDLFGYARAELNGQPVEALLPQALRGVHEQHRADYGKDTKPRVMGTALLCRRKDGSEFPADINISPLKTNRGRLFMAVVRDVTARQRQEDELREAARYNRSLLDAVLDPLVMINTEGIVTDVNPAAEQITGLTREQLIGSDAASKFTDPQRLFDGFAKVVAEGKVLDYPMAIRHASGKVIPVMCNASLYRDGHGHVVGAFASARDVTESQRIQQEITASRQRLRELAVQTEAARENERKHIAREVHDELGQVLTALRMDLSFLGKQNYADAEALQRKAADMKALVDRAIQGVRNVASSLRPAVMDMGLVSAIEWVCSEFAVRTGLACELHAAQDQVDLDEARGVVLFRILQESLTNITRYAQASRVDVSLGLRDGQFWLEVKDNGQGFDLTAARQKKSYGLLGMQERAIALGGQVEIDSAPGQGTRISVTIPLDAGQNGKGAA
jgi:PAS domain S-box-containing protein